jgi:putative ABC transport system permease protein
MGAKTLLGRVFTAEEQIDGKDYVVVLSYGLWQKRFAADPEIIGRTISLNARPYTVVGVLPADFHSLPRGLLPAPAEFYRPVAEPPDEIQRASRHLRAIARLKPGVTLREARAEIELIAQQLQAEHPDTNTKIGLEVESLREDLVRPARPALLMLFAAAVFTLLIACANIGNLLLARSMTRYREVAIRAALGASRARVVRQFLTESILLAAAGGALGLLAAVWSTSLLEAVGSRVIPMLSTIEIDVRVLLFAGVTSILTGIVFGSAPALRASRVDLNETLNDGGRSPGAAATRSFLRSALVVAEVALAMMLLISAGLLLKSVFRLSGVNPGFNPDRVLTMNVWLPHARYPTPPEIYAFYGRLLDRLRELPGVESAGLTSVMPMTENFDRRTLEIDGQPKPPSELPELDSHVVTPGYFETMSLQMLRGRAFDAQDTATAPLVMIASESMARRLWPGEDPLGKRVGLYHPDPTKQQPWHTIVGVVRDVKQYGLDRADTAAVYIPHAQKPMAWMTLTVRTRTDPAAMVEAVRREIRAIDPEQAVFSVATMDQVLAESMALRRLSMFLLAGFAALALLLAAIGIYGVLAQIVAQRTHEIGIRMALGAQMRDVLNLVLGHGMALAGLGIAAGIAGALGVTRLLANLLFGVAPTDPSTFVAIALLLGAVAFLACYLPARRAAKLDPVIALNRP